MNNFTFTGALSNGGEQTFNIATPETHNIPENNNSAMNLSSFTGTPEPSFTGFENGFPFNNNSNENSAFVQPRSTQPSYETNQGTFGNLPSSDGELGNILSNVNNQIANTYSNLTNTINQSNAAQWNEGAGINPQSLLGLSNVNDYIPTSQTSNTNSGTSTASGASDSGMSQEMMTLFTVIIEELEKSKTPAASTTTPTPTTTTPTTTTPTPTPTVSGSTTFQTDFNKAFNESATNAKQAITDYGAALTDAGTNTAEAAQVLAARSEAERVTGENSAAVTDANASVADSRTFEGYEALGNADAAENQWGSAVEAYDTDMDLQGKTADSQNVANTLLTNLSTAATNGTLSGADAQTDMTTALKTMVANGVTPSTQILQTAINATGTSDPTTATTTATQFNQIIGPASNLASTVTSAFTTDINQAFTEGAKGDATDLASAVTEYGAAITAAGTNKGELAQAYAARSETERVQGNNTAALKDSAQSLSEEQTAAGLEADGNAKFGAGQYDSAIEDYNQDIASQGNNADTQNVANVVMENLSTAVTSKQITASQAQQYMEESLTTDVANNVTPSSTILKAAIDSLGTTTAGATETTAAAAFNQIIGNNSKLAP